VNRWLLALIPALTSIALAATEAPKSAPVAPASSERVIGVVQPEIRLSDGRVFKNARVLDVTPLKESATISDGTRVRVVPLNSLPAALRDQLLAEKSRTDGPRYNVYRDVRPPPPPPDQVITPAPPVTPVATPTIIDQLIAQAVTEAPDELKLYLVKSGERVSSLTTKIRKTEQVPGWQKIRVSGDASFSTWDNLRRDYVWRTDKFEVEFAIVSVGTALKLDTVSFAGISRQADPNY
jgi:hypothetical protein